MTRSVAAITQSPAVAAHAVGSSVLIAVAVVGARRGRPARCRCQNTAAHRRVGRRRSPPRPRWAGRATARHFHRLRSRVRPRISPVASWVCRGYHGDRVGPFAGLVGSGARARSITPVGESLAGRPAVIQTGKHRAGATLVPVPRFARSSSSRKSHAFGASRRCRVLSSDGEVPSGPGHADDVYGTEPAALAPDRTLVYLAFREAWVFDASHGAWILAAAFPMNRHGGALGLGDGRAIALGGEEGLLKTMSSPRSGPSTLRRTPGRNGSSGTDYRQRATT